MKKLKTINKQSKTKYESQRASLVVYKDILIPAMREQKKLRTKLQI